MTKDRVVGYARELGYLVNQAREAEATIAMMNSDVEIAKATGDTKRAEQVLTHRAELRTKFQQVSELAMQKANRKDLDGCERLLQQLQARLDELTSYEQEAAVMEARFEMAAAMKEFQSETNPEGTSREAVEKLLTKSRDRVAQQLTLAGALVPDKPVVLSLV